MRRCAQPSHCSTWPPSAAVRQAAMARRTRRCAPVVGCVRRYSSPVRAHHVGHLEARRAGRRLLLLPPPPPRGDGSAMALRCERRGRP